MRSSEFRPIQAVSTSGEGILKCSFPEFKGDHPDWSPDGKWIAYDISIVKRPEGSQIYVIPSTGGEPLQVTFDEYGAQYPSWNPEGHLLAYLGDDGISIADLNCLTNSHECLSVDWYASRLYPDWSPDGQYLLYAIYSKDKERIFSYLVSPLDSPEEVIDVTPTGTRGCGSAKWSPDGRSIVAHCLGESASDIYVIDWPTLTATNLTNSPEVFDMHPIWSPDGTRIAFASENAEDLGKCLNMDCTSGSKDVFMINADGTGFRRITFREDKAVVWIAWMPLINGNDK